MNLENPILTAKSEAVLQDGVVVDITGRVFNNPIFPGAEAVYNQIEVSNQKTGAVMGNVFYADPMTKDQLIQMVDFVARDPEPALYPGYRKNGK